MVVNISLLLQPPLLLGVFHDMTWQKTLHCTPLPLPYVAIILWCSLFIKKFSQLLEFYVFIILKVPPILQICQNLFILCPLALMDYNFILSRNFDNVWNCESQSIPFTIAPQKLTFPHPDLEWDIAASPLLCEYLFPWK